MSQGHTNNDPVYVLAAPPLSPLVFTGRDSGLYRSEDGGASWQPVQEVISPLGPAPTVSVAVSPSYSIDRTVIAGVPGGALRSTDGGVSWQALPFQPPAPYLTALVFSPNYLEDGVILAGAAEDGFLRTDNGGDRWSTWNFGLLDLEVLCLAVSPAFARDDTLFAGTSSGLFRSTNGGRAWREMQLPCGHVPVLSLAMDSAGLRLYAGTEAEGLYASADSGKSWTPFNSGLLEGAINSVLACAGETPCLAALVEGAVLISASRQSVWRSLRLPGEGKAASAIFAPQGFGLDLPLVIGFDTGEVLRIDSVSPYLK